MTARIKARLASAIGRRDEEPNIRLAAEIAAGDDADAVAELVTILRDGKRSAQNDAIKVLYEAGEQNPQLISNHVTAFREAMRSKNNRLAWGALTALNCVSRVNPAEVALHLDEILLAADRGSVIAKDQAINILINLKTSAAHAAIATPLLLGRLKESASNQLPMYAERILPVLSDDDLRGFCEVLKTRLADDDMPRSKRSRLEKVLRRAIRAAG